MGSIRLTKCSQQLRPGWTRCSPAIVGRVIGCLTPRTRRAVTSNRIIVCFEPAAVRRPHPCWRPADLLRVPRRRFPAASYLRHRRRSSTNERRCWETIRRPWRISPTTLRRSARNSAGSGSTWWGPGHGRELWQSVTRNSSTGWYSIAHRPVATPIARPEARAEASLRADRGDPRPRGSYFALSRRPERPDVAMVMKTGMGMTEAHSTRVFDGGPFMIADYDGGLPAAIVAPTTTCVPDAMLA